MNRFKKSLITIEDVENWLNSFEPTNIIDGIVNGMAFIVQVGTNILLFPLVIVRYIKNK